MRLQRVTFFPKKPPRLAGRLALWLSPGLLLALSLSACAAAADEAPAGLSGEPAESRTLAQKALSYTSRFREGNFEDIPVNQSLSPQKVKEDWEGKIALARDFRESKETEVLTSEDEILVDVTSIHARYQLCSSFRFGPDEALRDLSFSLKPLAVQAESSEKWYEEAIILETEETPFLNGMLTLPKDAANPPVAILIWGSGANNMDSLIGSADNCFFADLAHVLAERGVASIRYDKRSYAQPEAAVADIQWEYLADIKTAVRFALAEDRVNGEELFLVAHSQGGMLSPKIAADNPEFKGLISMGGTLRPMADVILEQNLTMNTIDESLTPDQREAADEAIRQVVENIKSLGEEATASPDILLYGYPETYWKSLNVLDLASIAEELSSQGYPMLILQGMNDFQVLYETDFPLWQEITAENPNASYIAYPGLSHVFMPGDKVFDGSVYNAPAHVDEQVMADIAQWISYYSKNLGRRK